MKWFRVYSEARTDAKLESLTDAQHRVWFRLMCFAGDQDERGDIIGYDEELLAVEVARGDVDLLRSTLERLVKLRIIAAGDGVRFVNWRERQYDKPSDSPEQTRARKAKSRASSIEEQPVTPMSRDVTPHKQIQTQIQSTDTEQEDSVSHETARALASLPAPFTLLEAFCDEAGQDITAATERWKSEHCKHTEALITAGCTEAEFRRLTRYALSQTWRDTAVTPKTLRGMYDDWVMASRPEREQPKRGSPNQRTHDNYAKNLAAAQKAGLI